MPADCAGERTSCDHDFAPWIDQPESGCSAAAFTRRNRSAADVHRNRCFASPVNKSNAFKAATERDSALRGGRGLLNRFTRTIYADPLFQIVPL